MYNLSADKLPGKGVGEKLDSSREKEFTELSKVKNDSLIKFHNFSLKMVR